MSRWRPKRIVLILALFFFVSVGARVVMVVLENPPLQGIVVSPETTYLTAPLHYEQTRSGYRLYSVGPNMKDDGGIEDEQQSKDDLGVEAR